MVFLKTFIVFVVFMFLSDTNAAGSRIGAGVIIGEPTGVSLKSWSSKSTAIDGALAWSFSGRGFLHIHTDYIVHNYKPFSTRELRGKLALYYGMGIRIRLKEEDNINLGVRFPLGLNYLIPKTPFELFFELVPILNLIPGTVFNLNGGLGVRFYF